MGTLLIDDPVKTDDLLSFERVSAGWATGTAWDETWAHNPITSVTRGLAMADAQEGPVIPAAGRSGVRPQSYRQAPETPLLSSDQAEEQYGIPGQLTFKDYGDGIHEPAAKLLNQWKQEEIQRSDILARATPGFVPGAARLGVELGASVLDPINLASAFIPVLPEARFLAMAGKIGLTGARAARGALEGAVGQAAVEPLILMQARTEQSDYDAYDSLLNVTFGALLGAGLHVGGGLAKDLVVGKPDLRPRPDIPAMTAETHHAALGGAVAAVAEDRPVMVADYVRAVSRRDSLMSSAAIPGEVRLPEVARFTPPDGLADIGTKLSGVDGRIAEMESAGMQTAGGVRLVDLYRERQGLLDTARASVPEETWADGIRAALYEPSKEPKVQKARTDIAAVENKIQAFESDGAQARGGERLTDLRRARIVMLEKAESLLTPEQRNTLARTALQQSSAPVGGQAIDASPPPAGGEAVDPLDQTYGPPRVDANPQTFGQAWEAVRNQQASATSARPTELAALSSVDAKARDFARPATVETESQALRDWTANDTDLVNQQRSAGNLDETDEALLKDGDAVEQTHLNRAKALEALGQCLIA